MIGNLDKELEAEILQTTDRAIEKIISVSKEGDRLDADRYKDSINIIAYLCKLLTPVIEGREEHLEELIRQLIRQKLPSNDILQSFGDFYEDLEGIIQEGLQAFYSDNPSVRRRETSSTAFDGQDSYTAYPSDAGSEKSEEGNEERFVLEQGEKGTNFSTVDTQDFLFVDEEKEPEGSDDLEKAVKIAYPGERFCKRYYLRGITLDCYLPDLKIAVSEKTAERYPHRKNYICKEHGIANITLAPFELENPREAARIIRRRSSETLPKY